MSTVALKAKWSVVVGPLVFLGFVLVAGAVGGGMGAGFLAFTHPYGTQTRTRTRTEVQDPKKVRVTHVIFNHNFKEVRRGPQTKDALSMRRSWDYALDHGPDSNGSEPGAGEWIVDPANENSKSTRNEPSLWTKNDLYTNGIEIWARFEATGNVAKAKLSFVTQGDAWFAGPPVEVQFKAKGASPQNKYTELANVSNGTGSPDCYPTTTEYVKIPVSGGIPNVIRRSFTLFQWEAEIDGVKQKINASGYPDPDQFAREQAPSQGHRFYSVLGKTERPWPTHPWYDAAEAPKTNPWMIALDEAIVPGRGNTQGSADPFAAANKLATYLIGTDYKYDIGVPNTPGAERGFTSYSQAKVSEISASSSARIDLERYINRRGVNPRGATVVNCTDQGSALTSYLNLVGCSTAVYWLGPKCGLLNPNGVTLVGNGKVTHPLFGFTSMFDNNPLSLKNPVPNQKARSYFSIHALTAVADGGPTQLFDATLGPPGGGPFAGLDHSTYVAQALSSEAVNTQEQFVEMDGQVFAYRVQDMHQGPLFLPVYLRPLKD